MTKTKVARGLSTASLDVSKNVYSTEKNTFTPVRIHLGTGAQMTTTGGGVYILDSRESVGSFSVSSSQNSYRMLNTGLMAKAGRR